jgi:CubicO group peptidase (beta-lactamase class C family)
MIDLDAPTGLHNPHNGLEPDLRDFANHSSSVSSSAAFGSLTTDPDRDLAPVEITLRKKVSWNNVAPGTAGAYSNTGAAWPARYLETVIGTDFDGFTRQHIFDPLGMASTGWFMTDFPSQGDLAIGYWANGTKTNEHGVWPYPMGNLRSTANDLALFMIMWTTGGSGVLSQNAIDGALQLQGVTGFGVNWARASTSTGRVLWGHGGALAGVCTRLNIDPLRQDGVVILTNGQCMTVGVDINAIEDRAFRILDEL